ncbi:MAG TPA: fructose-bisphosphate aldolase class I [Candidatus Paceibacterota bacterium]|nr:fructose-bisphosphate aldolase class I [Candidatus Paceibacterota bacterium]HRZ34363.1 fructose-bisphosphate aldolase class I [Candidatus Paceibacterota bacterium]
MKNLDKKYLEQTASCLMAKDKGILAADESNETAGKRLADIEVANTQENRRLYRELFLGLPGLEKYISGVILFDETFWQKSDSDAPYPQFLSEKNILPGIKIDLGAKDFPGFPGEKLTVGLDDLPERVKKYAENGATFVKWRAVIIIDEKNNLPTPQAIEANADALGRYARICQEAGLVPILEPEVLLNGPHSIAKAEETTTIVLKKVFEKVQEHKVHVPGLILKTSMVIQGDENPDEASPEEIAEATVRVLLQTVPKNIGGVVFLSGGQTPIEASAHLDAIAEKRSLPFEIAFSYARALQGPAMQIWKGKPENVEAARIEFKKRLQLNTLADAGDYDISLEYSD